MRLIRSKGVGIFFVTQNPIDVPETLLGQLGNRAQHALRAFSPRDQKAVKAAAQTFRANPKIDVEQVITQLGVGEALVSFLDEKGIPVVVDRATIFPPHSQIGPITPEQRAQIIQNSVIAGVYEKTVDRESAYEKLKGKSCSGRNCLGLTCDDTGSANRSRRCSRGQPDRLAPGGWLADRRNVLGSGTGRRETAGEGYGPRAPRVPSGAPSAAKPCVACSGRSSVAAHEDKPEK